MSRFLNARLAALKAYTPGEQPRDRSFIKLNTNESPYPPSERVLQAAAREAVRLNLYSDPVCADLRDAIAGLTGLRRENICATNGSDEALNFIFMAYGARGAVYPDISYGFYPVFSELHGLDALEVPLKKDFSLEASDYFNKNALVVLANPNAPTGMTKSLEEIEQILRANPDGVVAIDEAYVDFGGESALTLIPKYENLLVVQTFSKSRSLAGGRLGFAAGQRELIADLEKLRYSTNPYNLNRMTLAAGVAAIEENDYYMENCQKIIATREETACALREMGFSLTPSRANFLFAAHPHISGLDLCQKLRARGILVRHFAKPRIENYNRITVGTPEEMRALIGALSEILKEGA